MWTRFLARTMIVGELTSLYSFLSIEAHEALLTTKSTHRSLVLVDRTALGIQIAGLVLSAARGFIFAKGEVRTYTIFPSHLNGGWKASGYGFSRCSSIWFFLCRRSAWIILSRSNLLNADEAPLL